MEDTTTDSARFETGQDFDEVDTVLCDLDGVIWLAHEPIAGSVEAIARLQASGRRVLFVTNNSSALISQHETALAAIDIDAHHAVVSSATAAGLLLEPGFRVLCGGGAGIVEAVASSGAVATLAHDETPAERFDAVVVGMYRAFNYRALARLSSAIGGGARFIATNDDATYPTPHGPEPGGGAIVAAVSTASGVTPTVAGKPNPAMANAVRTRLVDFDPARTVMVGDRWSTDGAFAEQLSCRYVQVRSGVTAPGAPVAGKVDIDVPDLATFVDDLLASR